ncbi:MAG: hypothetical protein L3J36_15480 [Rhodobacteraceae bacterium]|nr:hypothetical protein [Paracoccaceae bacterium]
MLLNIAKAPLSAGLGLITVETLTLNLTFLPAILAGGFLGCKVLHYINIRLFAILIGTAVLVAAIRLIAF